MVAIKCMQRSTLHATFTHGKQWGFVTFFNVVFWSGLISVKVPVVPRAITIVPPGVGATPLFIRWIPWIDHGSVSGMVSEC